MDLGRFAGPGLWSHGSEVLGMVGNRRAMIDVRYVGYNRKRQQHQRSRRCQWRHELLQAYGQYGGMAALARRLGVHRSTILKDCRAVWAEWLARRGCPG